MNIKVFIAMRNVSCSQMVQNTRPSLYTNEKCKSNFNNNSSKVFLMFSSESVINKIVYTSDSALTICGPEFQRTSIIAYSCFCLLYKCSPLWDALDSVSTTALSSVETTDWGNEMAVLERVAERLLRSSFVDLGTGTLGSSVYLLYFLMWYPSFIKMRVKHDL